MKRIGIITILSVVFILSGTKWLNAQKAYIQVVSEPGVSVYLNDVFKGKTSSELGGIIIENVNPGIHKIKIIKDGYNPQEDQINVKPGEVYTHKVRPFVPAIKIEQKGSVGEQKINLQVGRVKIQSLPVGIKISIPKLGVNSEKKQDEWIANEIPVGTYNATFTWQGKTLNYSISVNQNQETHLFVNMIQLKVEVRSTGKPITTSQVGGQTTNNLSGTSNTAGNFTDPRDGKTYKTITIGNQTWMAENINYATGSGSWCYENNPQNCSRYGRMYDWETAKSACPPGWHLPSETEWKQLLEFSGASNSIGLSTIRGGYRSNYDQKFILGGIQGNYWSNTECSSNAAWCYQFYQNDPYAIRNAMGKENGTSVRCVRD